MNFFRTMIIGCPGSGKTTFSQRFANILETDVVHLDKVLWKPKWEMMPYEERVAIHNDLINGDTWIIDGMWRSHVEERIKRATAVIFLDYKRGLCIRRAISRRIHYAGKQRTDIADGCLEKLDSYFLRYIWKFPKETRPLIYKLLEQYGEGKDVFIFQNPQQTEKFLSDLEKLKNPHK